MKRALVVASVLLLGASTGALAQDPFRGVRWDQGSKLRVESGIDWKAWSDYPLQIGAGRASPSREFYLVAQYQFLEVPDFGKFDAYLEGDLLTGTDAPDKLGVGAVLVFTFNKALRFETGAKGEYNIGNKQPDWGRRSYWVGLCGKVFSHPQFLLVGCGQYHFLSNYPATLDSGVEKKDPLTFEFGPRLYYLPSEYFTFGLEALTAVDRKIEVRKQTFSPSVLYHIGEHLNFPGGLRGLSIKLGGSFSLNINVDGSCCSKKSAKEVTAGLVWEWK